MVVRLWRQEEPWTGMGPGRMPYGLKHRAPRWLVAGLLGLGLALLFGMQEAWAQETRTVPTSPGCETIQSCVETSDDGDTVKIKPGQYRENVTVDKSLTIQGTNCKKAQRVIVDAQLEDPPENGSQGTGFLVTADGVKIRCLSVRHGSTGIQAGSGDTQTGEFTSADDLRLDRITVEGSNRDNVNVIGDRFQIQRSNLFSSDDNAVDVEGNGAQVIKVIARGHNNDCTQIRGDNASVEGSRFERCEDGDGADLSESDDARISGNTTLFSDGGISASGAAPQVTGNTVRGSGDDGFEIDCTARCEDGLVEGNTAAGASDDADGFDIDSDDDGLRILNNTASDNIATGFYLNIEGATVRGNTAERNGSESESESGFNIFGDDNLIEDNRANQNKRDGFRLSPDFDEGDEGSDNNVFRKNTAGVNSKDGFDIDADDTDGDGQDDLFNTGTRLIQNVATNNRAEGIENNGLLTDVIGNRSSGNRTDCANSGTIDENQDNRCADGSNFNEPPEVE